MKLFIWYRHILLFVFVAQYVQLRLSDPQQVRVQIAAGTFVLFNSDESKVFSPKLNFFLSFSNQTHASLQYLNKVKENWASHFQRWWYKMTRACIYIGSQSTKYSLSLILIIMICCKKSTRALFNCKRPWISKLQV